MADPETKPRIGENAPTEALHHHERRVEPDPRAVYLDRLQHREARRVRLEYWDNLLSHLRLGLFLAIIALGWWAGWWALVPAILLFTLVVAHGRIRERLRRITAAVQFHEMGLARLDGSWQGRGVSGDRFRDDVHPYADDLDLFGAGSLFELLCTAKTRAGEDVLARWLLTAAAVEEIRDRNEAIQELTGRLDLREEIALLGADIRGGLDPSALSQWGSADPTHLPPGIGLLAKILGLLAVATLFSWLAGALSGSPFVLVVFAECGVYLVTQRRVRAIVGTIERHAAELGVLARLLRVLEAEPFNSRWLRTRERSLGQHELGLHADEPAPPSASEEIARLARLVHLLESQRNQLFMPFAFLLMWNIHLARVIESWRTRNGKKIAVWLESVGEFEAISALSGYAFDHPGDPFPRMRDPLEDGGSPPSLIGEGLGHPLLATGQCVPNDIHLGDGPRVLIVSGSNMSGKSTFLRTVGINVVLAQAGAPVRASRLELTPLAIGATLRVQDSLQAGRSRFMAELLRLKVVTELARGRPPLLFLLDELLHGTNSHDRRRGAEAIVRGLMARGAIGLVTTHDLALTSMAEALTPEVENVHFADHFEEGAMKFDYRMRPGVVEHSNALELMRSVGLEVDAVSAR